MIVNLHQYQDPEIFSFDTVNGDNRAIEAAFFNIAGNPNLLDNWYFVGGGTAGKYPINQRGVSGTISSPGYFIDRWKLVSGTVQITSAGLVLNGTISQILEFSPGVSPLTASALSTTGPVEATYSDASKTFSITATGQNLIAAKLEIGSVSTLYYQRDGIWILIDPVPKYQTELAKCQRFQQLVGNLTGNIYCGDIFIATSSTVAYGYLSTIIPMRVMPTVSKIENLLIGIPGESPTDIDTITTYVEGKTGIYTSVSVAGGLNVGKMYYLRILAGGIILNANL